MASDKLIQQIKQQAQFLKSILEKFDIPIKHTKSLELVARIMYGYPSWNVAKGNSPDRRTAETYNDFVKQIATLADAVDGLRVTESDLEFVDGEPAISQLPYFQLPAAILASIYLDRPFAHTNFYDLVAERFIPEDMFAHYPEALLPQSNYMAFQMARLNLEFAGDRPTDLADYPWQKWADRMTRKGELNADTITAGRSVYRECLQHQWDLDYVLLCGGFDDGRVLEKMLLQWPEKTLKVIDYLMDTDGGKMQ